MKLYKCREEGTFILEILRIKLFSILAKLLEAWRALTIEDSKPMCLYGNYCWVALTMPQVINSGQVDNQAPFDVNLV